MDNNENNISNNEEEKIQMKSNRMKISNVIIIIVIILLLAIIIFGYFISRNTKEPSKKIETQNNENNFLAYRLSGNTLEDFDLYFLKLENEEKNKIYSPLSIKYALGMLNEGASGKSKEQISNIIGTYSTNKYVNTENMSFANALFIKDSYRDSIKESYVNTLSDKYNASVIYDSFTTPNVLNSWVSDRTFNLINDLFDNVSNQDFILVNSLAIDMEWVNKIQSEDEVYRVNYAHEDYTKVVSSLEMSDYHDLDFKDLSYKAKAVQIGAVINKYDIVTTLGEDNIRKTVGNEYKKWLDDGAPNSCGSIPEDVNTYLDKYIEEIDEGYGDISSSTDFLFYVDDDVKVFAKDLKEYNGTTLQYIGIMPKEDDLDNYIKNINASSINKIINDLKPIELNSFKNGVITEISGYIPMFKFDYELNLMSDLNKLGITNVFDADKADLSNLTEDNVFIDEASHKANIEFSNIGIKASAATTLSHYGGTVCGFDYLYEVPVERIDLTFNRPYLFLIRDKNSSEVWFTGTVYEPIEFQSSIDYFY